MLAALFTVCAACLAALRRLGKERALGDAVTAILAVLPSITLGVISYAAAARSSQGATWRNVGALCFAAFPVLSVGALSLAAHRRGWRRGSVFGALLGGGLAVALVGTWVTVYLKGVRGGWTPVEILVCLGSISLAFIASSCLGWWCGRAIRQKNA